VDSSQTAVRREPNAEADRLRALAQYAVLDTASEPAFDDLVRLAATLMSVPFVAINLVDDRRTWAKAAIGVPQGFEVSREESPFCAMATLATAVTAHLELRRKVGEAQELAIQLQHLASHDGLTGLANRRSFDGALAAAMAHAERTGEQLGIILLDLDHFKNYNDSYGHVAGDDLLRRCAQRWSTATRDTDLLARYGGEEFAVIALGCGVEECVALAERLRGAMPDSQTCSSGVTIWWPGESADDLLRRADRLMYAAKNGGRDAVKCG
jgi:diguanylate cyclase (GGDEF)-like protein